MMKCWQDDPKRRPTFIDLRNQLKGMETSHKVELLYLSTSLIKFIFEKPVVNSPERQISCQFPRLEFKKKS